MGGGDWQVVSTFGTVHIVEVRGGLLRGGVGACTILPLRKGGEGGKGFSHTEGGGGGGRAQNVLG